MAGFESLPIAMAIRDIIRAFAKQEIAANGYGYRMGIVTSIAPDRRSCGVILNGDQVATPVNVGSLSPIDVDCVVRVAGMPGDKFIDDILGPHWHPEGAGATAAVYSRPLGDGVATDFVVNHGLATDNVIVQVFDGTGLLLAPTIHILNVDQVEVTFGVAPTLNGVRVVIVG